MPLTHYPHSVAEVLKPRKKYSPAALRAARAFARSKPFAGTVADRQGKFRTLNAALAAAYGVDEPKLRFENEMQRDSGSSRYILLHPGDQYDHLEGSIECGDTAARMGSSVVRSEGRDCLLVEFESVSQMLSKSWARLEFDGHIVGKCSRRE